MWVILDSEDSRKWIISSLNGLVHWNVGFQSLNTVIYDVVLNWPQNDDQDFMAAMEFDHVIISIFELVLLDNNVKEWNM